MLKKVGHISLVILLLFSTMGVTIYKHYCGTAFIKQTISITPDNCCKGHCDGCHNEMKQLKITDSFEANNNQANFKAEITKIFDCNNFAIALLNVTYQINTSNNLFYKVKTCENVHSTLENSTALLQVFRL
jgi:hypothetical protein